MQDIKDSLFQLNLKKKREKESFFEIFDVIDMLDKFFDTSDFTNLYKETGTEMENYFKQFSYEGLLKYLLDYELIMPGKVIQTNAPVISGDTLKWLADLLRMLPSDYVLSAQTRSVNIWAFVITLLFAIFVYFCYVKFNSKK